MEQHPIPQDITGFKFKLVGDMTLKQFGELAGGAIFAYLFYSTGWHPAFKWPLVIFLMFSGFALAFLPIEERPLDQWVVNFLRAVYRPSLLVWQRTPPDRAGFTTLAHTKTPTFPPPPAPWPFHLREEPLPPPRAPKEESPAGSLSVADLHKLRDQKQAELSKTEQALEETIGTVKGDLFRAANKPITVEELAHRRDDTRLAEEIELEKSLAQNNNILSQIESLKTRIQALQGTDTVQLQAQLTNLSGQQQTVTKQIADLQVKLHGAPTASSALSATEPAVRVVAKSVVKQANISLTDTPNVISGLITSEKGAPLENVIVILKDKKGSSIRALKTNQVGQFVASTPLPNGTYYLEFERPNYTFDVLEVSLAGKIVPPIEINATPAAQVF